MVEPVRIDDEEPARASERAREHPLPPAPLSQPRPDCDHRRPAGQRRERGLVLDAAAHDLRAHRAHRGRVRRAGRDAHQARADPRGGLRGQPHRPREAPLPSDHEHVAVVSLVRPPGAGPEARVLRQGIVVEPFRGGRNPALERGRNAERITFHAPRVIGAGPGEKPPLRRDEGHGERGAHRAAAHAPGVGVEPGGDVHGQDRAGRGVHRVDGVRRGPRRGAREAGTEERVHHDALEGGGGGERLAPDPRPAHGLQHGGGVGAEPARVAHHEDPDLAAGLPGAARDHEPVAAVVAGAADDRDPARLRPAPDEGTERPRACPFHERRPGEPGLRDGQPLDLADLRGGAQGRSEAGRRRGPAPGLRRTGGRGNGAAPGSIPGRRHAPGACSPSRTPRPPRAPTAGRGS